MLIAELVALAVVFVEIVPVTLVAKLQLFKLTVLVTLVASILTTAAFVRLLPDALRRFGEGCAGPAVDRAGRRRSSCSRSSPDSPSATWADRERCSTRSATPPRRSARSKRGRGLKTPTDALFAIPPSVSTFRTFARRAVVANYAAFVFTDADMQRWFVRLMDVAPIDPPPTGYGVKPVLDAAYHSHSADEWRRLQSGYGIDYALVERGTRLPFEVAFENAEWTVYRLPEAAP